MKKRAVILSLILSLQMILSMITVPVFAEDNGALNTPYDEPDTQVYNMNIDWKYRKPADNAIVPLSGAMANVAKSGKQFYDIDYDDADWETVSVPHQVNASDSFTSLGSNQGDTGQFRGIVFYRKHFTIPEGSAGKKFIVEFEGMDCACYLWVNGEPVGYYEAGINAFGFDISKYINATGDNVIALANDSTVGRGNIMGRNDNYYAETIPGHTWGDNSGQHYEWNSHEFRPTQAGLVYNVNLYVKEPIYQTLALYDNLKTKGTYIYADNFDIKNKKATIHVDAEVRNETDSNEELTLQVDVVKNVDSEDGKTKTPMLMYSFTGTDTAAKAAKKDDTYQTVVKAEVYDEDHVHENTTGVDTIDVSHITADFNASELDFWSTDTPHLYDVYTTLKKGDTVLDVQKITTGFRKVEYTINDGLRINDKYVWLTGYAQRSSNEWAAIGAANDWLTDYDMSLVKESGSNFIRWMHIAPRVNAVRATDKYGIVVVAPAGDKEANATNRQWSQRVEVMRSTMISFRNSPSVIFWEAGNNAITAEHQAEMTALKTKLDPNGGRFCGCRTLTSEEQVGAAEYVGTMLNRHASTAKTSMTTLDKFMPIVETEYYREESARRVWDDYSPPDYDLDNYYKGDAATAGYDFYDFTSEDFVVKGAEQYEQYFRDRVNGLSGNNYYTAAAALCWTDSNQHARTLYSENGRMSGRVDAIRIPKQSFYAYQVMQQEDSSAEEITKEGVTEDNEKKHVHIVGHWNYEPVDDKTREQGGNYYYPIKEIKDGVAVKTGEWGRRDPTKKTVYVVGSQFVSRVELLVDGVSKGSAVQAQNTFIYSFPNIDVTQGKKVEAVAYDVMGNEIGRDEIKRAGDPVSVRLTPHTGAEGLLADGSDLMYFDVEVVDAQGNVCPLSYDRIDFELTGDAKFMGGYNSGYATNKKNENRTTGDHDNWGAGETVIGKTYVYAECGVNRVFVKAGKTAGTITLKATINLNGSPTPATQTVTASEYPEEIKGGLTKHRQQSLDFGSMPEVEESKTEPMKPLGKFVTVAKSDWKLGDLIYKVKKHEQVKDNYTVYLNGTELKVGETLVNQSYKPDSSTGVVTDVKPVLDELLKLGADFTYTEGTALIASTGTTELAITVTSKKGQDGIDGSMHTLVIARGQTAIGYDGDPEGVLTNAQIEQAGDQLMMEIAVLMSFIDGASTSIDETNKQFNINFDTSKAKTN